MTISWPAAVALAVKGEPVFRFVGAAPANAMSGWTAAASGEDGGPNPPRANAMRTITWWSATTECCGAVSRPLRARRL